MKLEWMGEHRETVEQLIRYCNMYAASYKVEWKPGTEVPVSYAQMQIIEYLLENEELQMNMKQIAERLGITTSNFTKLVNKLTHRGFLKKYHTETNKKDVIIQVTDYGKKIYEQYSRFIYEEHFSRMFEVAEQIPKEYRALFAEALKASMKFKEKELLEDGSRNGLK